MCRKKSHIEKINTTTELENLIDYCIFEKQFNETFTEHFEISAKITNPQTIKEYESNISYHRKEGEYFFKLAQERSYVIPNWSARQFCKNCFESVLTGALSVGYGSITARITVAVAYMLFKYGIDMYDEWFGINEALEKAQWHFAMEEWHFRELHQDFRQNEPYREKPRFSGKDHNQRMFEV